MSSSGEFDVVHVISDLHLGGEQGREMFREEARLAGWIDRVAADGAQRVALVLAGDVVDFISVYRKGTYFSPADAVRQLDALFGPDRLPREGTPVARLTKLRDSLRAYLRRDGRTLVVMIGNHDVELAIPMVRERLREHLCDDDPVVRARVVFAVDGQGWRCKVGERVVYCVHGNEADPANVNDHEGMRLVAAGIERGEQLLGQGEAALIKRYWKRNFGTSLVVDVLNEARSRAPFVDLLKPEGEPLVDIIQALLPEEFSDRIGALVSLAPRAARAYASRGTLGEAPSPEGDAREVGDARRRPANTTGPSQSATLPAHQVERMEALLRDGLAPEELASNGTLGFGDLAMIKLRQAFGMSPTRSLLRSLLHWKALNNYRSVDQSDDVVTDYAPHLGPDVDVFIAGHTHAPRAFQQGRRAYFNSGTWINLLRIDEIVPQGADVDEAAYQRFEENIAKLRARSSAELTEFLDRERMCTAVTVRADAARPGIVRATLHAADATAVVGQPLGAFTVSPAGATK